MTTAQQLQALIDRLVLPFQELGVNGVPIRVIDALAEALGAVSVHYRDHGELFTSYSFKDGSSSDYGRE